MGGAVAVPGNTSPHAEFNFYVDPEAANAVFAAPVPLRLLPLDVTEQLVLLRARLRQLAQERDSAVFQFVREFTVLYFDFHLERVGINGGYLHDPAAVTAAIHPEWFTWRRARLRVETDDADRGRVRAAWDENSLRHSELPLSLPRAQPAVSTVEPSRGEGEGRSEESQEQGRLRVEWDEAATAQVATAVEVARVVDFIADRVCR